MSDMKIALVAEGPTDKGKRGWPSFDLISG